MAVSMLERTKSPATVGWQSPIGIVPDMLPFVVEVQQRMKPVQ